MVKSIFEDGLFFAELFLAERRNTLINSRAGTFIEVDKDYEMRFADVVFDSWATGYPLVKSTWTSFDTASCDQIDDPTNECGRFDGTTTSSWWIGGEAGGHGQVLDNTTTSPSAVNQIPGVEVRGLARPRSGYVEVSVAGAGKRILEDMFSTSGQLITSIVQNNMAGHTTISGAMPSVDFYPQSAAVEQNVQIDHDSVFAEGLPYLFNSDLSWKPALKTCGACVGCGLANVAGRAEVAYPWMHVKYNFVVEAPGSSIGAATIAGLPAKCAKSFGEAGGGGSMVWVRGMARPSGAVMATGRGNSNAAALFQPSATDPTQVTKSNFTSASGIGGQMTCQIGYAQISVEDGRSRR
jgi:hypothetical protein